ncbi:hypothetical protein ACIG87_30430 [Micromonospora sp. NPDC051925]|uniref:hypothetical protein n=1 Tax=Micromonospora sp. NPDC051925 TaxID=3364288 RepID=UPI0037CC6DC6
MVYGGQEEALAAGDLLDPDEPPLVDPDEPEPDDEPDDDEPEPEDEDPEDEDPEDPDEPDESPPEEVLSDFAGFVAPFLPSVPEARESVR